MIHFPFFSRSKSDRHSQEVAIYIEGFSRGFDMGLLMSTEMDNRVKEKIKQDSIDETLRRLGDNKLQGNAQR